MRVLGQDAFGGLHLLRARLGRVQHLDTRGVASGPQKSHHGLIRVALESLESHDGRIRIITDRQESHLQSHHSPTKASHYSHRDGYLGHGGTHGGVLDQAVGAVVPHPHHAEQGVLTDGLGVYIMIMNPNAALCYVMCERTVPANSWRLSPSLKRSNSPKT